MTLDAPDVQFVRVSTDWTNTWPSGSPALHHFTLVMTETNTPQVKMLTHYKQTQIFCFFYGDRHDQQQRIYIYIFLHRFTCHDAQK